MQYTRVFALAVALTMAVVSVGCFGGGDDGDDKGKGRTASRGKFKLGRKKDDKDRASADKAGRKAPVENQDEFSPESSMGRDLSRIRQQEERQAKKVAAMHASPNPNRSQIAVEERKLADIRAKAERYDVALQRYDMASRARPQREFGGEPAVVPPEMFQERPVRQGGTQMAAANPVQYQDDRVTHARLPLNYDRDPQSFGLPGPGSDQSVAYGSSAGSADEQERVLYDPRGDNAYAAAGGSRSITSPGSQPPGLRPQAGGPQPGTAFAGAPVGRANFPVRNSPAPWEGGSLFAETARAPDGASEVPHIYEERRRQNEQRAAASSAWSNMAMSPPAGAEGVTQPPRAEVTFGSLKPAQNSVAPAASFSSQPVDAGAGASNLVAPPAALKPPDSSVSFPAADMLEEEVFTPDMFLGG